MEELRRPPLSKEESAAFVRDLLFRMEGPPLPEDEAIELAMFEELAEENLGWDIF